mmetsp:Transcript_144036/g.461024  ORF Transcript_144036/g.461024 Transcript_144036/m.461024 type:complete len:312 (+) Transcript_144036:992-1927(+)
MQGAIFLRSTSSRKVTMAKAQAMLESPWALKDETPPPTCAAKMFRKSECLRESAPKAQAMCESCGAENLWMVLKTCEPISAMRCLLRRPETAKAQVSIAISAALNWEIWAADSWAMAHIKSSCVTLFLAKAQAMLASSGGEASLMLRCTSTAILLKRWLSEMRRFAKAHARCARSCDLKSLNVSQARSEIALMSFLSLNWRLAKDHAVIAHGEGEKSLAFAMVSCAMAFMSSSFRVPHCAKAHEMCEMLWTENVRIFAKHSPAIALTNCSFQSPHFAKAQAVLESSRCWNLLILLTTSAAITDIIASLRME